MRVEEAGRRWAGALAAWAIPQEILDAAPEPPWGFPTGLFARSTQTALTEKDDVTPSRRRAREALGAGGTVLDVGAGAGAASLPLAPLAAHITAVDEGADMLAAFADLADRRGVAHDEVLGRWPEVAPRAPPADLVVCHHVVYNVADIVGFVSELDRHARRRVVLEMTASHPLADLNAAWRALHGVVRPERPTAEDLVAVLEALGLVVHMERFTRPLPWADHPEDRVSLARRRLCVGPEKDDQIARLLPDEPRRLVTLWWDARPDAPA